MQTFTWAAVEKSYNLLQRYLATKRQIVEYTTDNDVVAVRAMQRLAASIDFELNQIGSVNSFVVKLANQTGKTFENVKIEEIRSFYDLHEGSTIPDIIEFEEAYNTRVTCYH